MAETGRPAPGARRPDAVALVAYGLAVLALGALCGARLTGSWDLFWHLAIGREVLSGGGSLPVDIFSWSAAGADWAYKDLAADVLLALGHDTLGQLWFAMWKGAVPLGLAAALALARRRGAGGGLGPLPWFAVTALLTGAICYRINERPLAFSLFLFPALLALLERARRHTASRAALARALVPALLLQLAWAQLHRAALIGVVLLAGFAAYLALAWVIQRRWPDIRAISSRPSAGAVATAAAAAAIAAGLTALNPSGVAIYTTATTVAGSEMLRQHIAEWQVMGPASIAALLPVAALLVVLGALSVLAALVRALRPGSGTPDPEIATPGIDIWHLGCLALMAWQTSGSVRWLPYLSGAAAVSLLVFLDQLAGRVTRRPPRLAHALVALAGVVLVWAAHPLPTGFGLVPRHYPESAITFAERHGLRPHVSNPLTFGGYLIWRGWPRFLVEIDGRNDMVYDADHIVRCRRAETDRAAFDAARAADGVDWVMAQTWGPQRSHRFLASHPDWWLVHYSRAALVYVRRDAYPRLAHLRLRHVPALASGAPFDDVLAAARGGPGRLDRLQLELERLADESPEDAEVLMWLARLYGARGEAYRERRDAVMERVMERAQDLAEDLVIGPRRD